MLCKEKLCKEIEKMEERDFNKEKEKLRKIIFLANKRISYNDENKAVLDAILEEIIEKGDAKKIYKFAVNVEGAPIDKLSYFIIKTGDAKYIYRFAKDVEGAKVQEFATSLNQLEAFEKANKLSNKLNSWLATKDIEYNYGIRVLDEKRDKSEELKNLFEKVEKEKSKEALIKLKIYFKFLSNENSTAEDAITCDIEYSEYMMRNLWGKKQKIKTKK